MFNYADGCCYETQKKSKESAELFGGFDKVFCFGKQHLDPQYLLENAVILNHRQGAGLWIWKYPLALRLLDNEDAFGKQVPENSYLCYCDSDILFTGPLDLAIDCLKRDTHNQSVMVFRSWNWHASSTQTKRDAFILCEADSPQYTETAGRVGGFWIFKKDDFSRAFFNTLYKYSIVPQIIIPPPRQPQYNIDDPLDNQMGKQNYPGFLRHSEDECLISIVAKKYDLYPYRFPAISKEGEIARVEDNLKNGGWCAPASAFTTKQYPELCPNKSNYPSFILHSSDRS